MKIDKLVLNNFRGFREMELELHPRLNVLIGINGSGKSSVLDAISVLLVQSFSKINNRMGCSEEFTATDVTHGCASSESLIHVSLEDHDAPLVWGDRLDSTPDPWHPDRKLRWNKIGQSDNKRLADLIKKQKNFPVLILFTPDRALKIASEDDFPDQPDPTLSFDRKYPRQSVYRHALRNFKRFHWLVQWFKDREEIEVRGLRDISHNRMHELRLEGKSPEGMDVQLEAVRSVIEKFTGLKSPRFYGDPLRLLATKGDVQLPIACFSEGEKSLLAMVGELARRLAFANPERDNPLEGSGVVMIDEIELHLHPTWQRMVVPRLLETFPNIQFIVTTHSPQVLGEIHSENIVVLENKSEGIQADRLSHDVHGMTSNQILKVAMGSDERTSEVEKAINGVYEALERNEIEQAKELLARLSKNSKDLIELERIEMRIRRKEVVGK